MIRSRALAAASLLVLTQGLLGMDCVDGVTPDCSDAAAQCGPPPDASADVSQPLPEASTNDTGADAPPADAADDAPADAGDEG